MMRRDEVAEHIEYTVYEMVKYWKDNRFSPRSAVEALGFNHMEDRFNYLDWVDLTKIARATYTEMMGLAVR